MVRKIFVSYKYLDSDIYQVSLISGTLPKARYYVF